MFNKSCATRRAGMHRVIAAACMLLVLAACTPEPPAPLRNLVVICVDTVRYDSFIAHPGEDDLTPWLAHAQQYHDASSTAPWTMPGVSSLLTGLYPVEHQAGQFASEVANLDEQIPSALSEEAKTLAERLDAAHFRTGAFVAHPFFQAELGLRQGFQQVHNRRGWQRNLDRMWQWADRIEPPDRFFGYLHFMEAHHRHTQGNDDLRGRVSGLSQSEREEIESLYPENCADPKGRRCLQSIVYESAVRELRNGVAAVLEGLKERDLLDETLVVLYSDHGEEFWDHEATQLERGNDPRPHTGLGHGQSLYQELLHIPLLAWHPGLEGGEHNVPVSLVDVVPSVLQWLDVETQDAQFSGELLPPRARQWWSSDPQRTLFASGIAYGSEQVAAREGSEKAIFHVVRDEFEIFDLATDPGERSPANSISANYGLGSLTGDYLELPPRVTGEQGELDAAQIEDLKAIGYLQGVEEAPTKTPEPAAEQEPEAGDRDRP